MKHDHARHTGQLDRLRRIEGQIGGLVRMVEEGRYCVGCRVYLEKLFRDLEIPLAADTPDAPDVTSPPR